MSSHEQKDSMQPKVGVYICHCGGNISDHVDVEQVARDIEKIPGVTVVHTNTFMCSDPGQELIQEDIKTGEINRVVVASCAPSLHEITFRNAIQRAGMNPYQYEHANIREQVSWVHHGASACAKAATLISAAVAKAKQLEAMDPIRVEAHRHATVIGGGIAGLRAAIDLSGQGLSVALIEKSPFLGGHAAHLDTLSPGGETATEAIRRLASMVMEDPGIQLYTCSRVVSSEGYVGNFKITVQQQPPADASALAGKPTGVYLPFAGFYPHKIPTDIREWTIDTGAIVFATGFETYHPRGGEFAFGESPRVITLSQLIRLIAEAKGSGKKLFYNGNYIRRLAVIHCVGSRQIPGIHEPDADGNLNEYCSRTCCSAALQAVIAVREQYPETHVLEYYRDIRTYGRGHEAYYERAAEKGVLFFRFEPEEEPRVEITPYADFPLKVTVKDSLTFGENVEAGVDLMVLAVGMLPGKIGDLVDMMKLPVGADRFLQEVHPKLRPVEMANSGMLLAGTCQAPMDISESCNGAQAASSKAAALLGKGYVELDPFVANVNLDSCNGTGACAAACPQKAISIAPVEADGNQAMRAHVNPAVCNGCGICVAVCTTNAIDVNGWSLKQYEDMVDAIIAA